MEGSQAFIGINLPQPSHVLGRRELWRMNRKSPSRIPWRFPKGRQPVYGLARLKLNDAQAGDQLEVADVCRSHSVSKLHCARSYQQIRKRNADTLGLALAVDLSGTNGDRDRDRLDGNTGQQLVKETLPPLAALGCVGASNAVREFEHRHHGNSDLFVTSFQRHGFEQLPGVLALAFGGDGRRRVEHQSQLGGSNASRCAATAASTSFAKSGSIVAVESAGIRAMHSEILRCTGSAGRMTATGCASRSTMTSIPVSTRCRMDRTSLAKSPSLMCNGSIPGIIALPAARKWRHAAA